MRTLAVTAAMIAVLAQPAYSQGPPSSKTPQQLIDEQKRREQADVEQRYDNRAKTPDVQVKDDPWRTIRPAAPGNQKR